MPNLDTLLNLSRRLNPEELQRFLASQQNSSPNVGANLQVHPDVTPEPSYRPMNYDLANQSAPQIPVENTIDRLKRMASVVPNREDYQPSTLRRIGAGFAGGLIGAGYGPKAGLETSTRIVDQPYNEAYQSWQSKMAPLEKVAALETTSRNADTSGLTALARLRGTDPTNRGLIAGEVAKQELPFKLAIQRPKLENATNNTEKIIKGRRENVLTEQAGDKERNVATNTSREQIAANKIIADKQKNDALINARTNQFNQSYNLNVNKFEFAKHVQSAKELLAAGNMTKAMAVTRSNAERTLAQSPEFKDLYIFDSKGNIHKKDPKDILSGWTGIGGMDQKTLNKLLIKREHILDTMVQGTIDTARQMVTQPDTDLTEE